jgi:large subunit ribosomal protein L29
MAEQIADIRKKSDAELEKLLREKRDELQQFRFSIAGTKVRNVKQGQHLRRDIARILTVLNERAHTQAAQNQ